jgi:mRNA-degrading endonuclease HigB of HigAB toxin-antitoxin module
MPTGNFPPVRRNKYRLIARILYRFKTVIVQYVLTHKESDKEAWKE